MGAQRLIFLSIMLGIVLFGIRHFKEEGKKSHVLRVCTWSNYYPDAVLEQFRTQTGIKIELSYFSSNEELLAKLKAGATGFDIIQPSDYMVRQMQKLNMLAPLDHTKLTHLNELEEFYRDLPYDPGLKFSVPFTWGTTGLAINTDKVTIPPEGVSWKMLFDSPVPRRTSLLDDMREVFGAMLVWNGLPLNTKDLPTLDKARKQIGEVKAKILMFTSEPKPLLLRDEISIAHVYSVDANQAHFENPKIRYFIPKEGGTLWTDNLAIPASSQRIQEAHVFIDYFLDPEHALAVVQASHLATPNRAVKAKLPAVEVSDPNIYPPKDVLDKMKFLDDMGDVLPAINRMWTELKS